MHRSWLAVLLLFLSTACIDDVGDVDGGDGDGGDGSGGDGGSDEDAGPFTGPLPEQLQLVFDIPADPIAVTLTLDPGSAASAEIDDEGGTLTATGPDGTRFDLVIPATALVVPTTITMTPVSAIEGMPFGTVPTAVQLEPEGLFLYELATLTITRPTSLPVDEQILFGWSGDGQDLILAPPVMDSTAPAIRLWHFSGYGVSKGFRADVESVRAKLGGSTEARLQNATAEFLSNERQQQHTDAEGSSFGVAALLALLDEYVEQVVKPRLDHVEDGCAEAKLAIQTALGVEQQYQLLGAESGLGLELAPLLEKGDLVCMREEHELCVEEHVIHRMVPAYLGMLRQAQLLGQEQPTAAQQEAAGLVNKCLKFELQFDSAAHFDDGGGGYDSTVTATAEMSFNAPALRFLPVSTALINTAFTFVVDGCSVTSVRGGGDYMAIDLGFSGDLDAKTVDRIEYVHFPGTTSESFTVSCPDQAPYTSPPQGMWSGAYVVLHEIELNAAIGGFVVSDWAIPGNELYATSEWTTSDVSTGTSEEGSLNLYHHPEP